MTGNTAKFHFISREATTKILKACPDLQWRLIVSLARVGGLRCPSEMLALNWEDSLRIAAKDYFQLRDEHFDRATLETAETTIGSHGNH